MSKNLYSYKGTDLDGRMFVYEEHMRKYNLNSAAIIALASALKSGSLEQIRTLFDSVEDIQKSGLLDVFIDYEDIENDFQNQDPPMGIPIKLATQFEHPDIISYLTKVEADLKTKKQVHVNTGKQAVAQDYKENLSQDARTSWGKSFKSTGHRNI
jgi:hypothetical protein